MHTKLKLRIDIFTDRSDFGLEELPGYVLRLTVLEKDIRFENNELMGGYIRFCGDDLYVKSNINKKYGGLLNDGIILPHSDKLGFPYNKIFNSDKERYNYLKMLYQTLGDWGNYWLLFQEDSASKIILKDNIWEIVCSNINE